MTTQKVIPVLTPDYEASSWLQFTGRRLVDGDPLSYTAFVSAYRCLAALTDYILEVGGPWSFTTAEDVLDVYHDYCLWFTTTAVDALPGRAFLPMTLDNLCALSQRRIRALAEFGGGTREEHPVFEHLHRKICEAAKLPDGKRRLNRPDDIYGAIERDAAWQSLINAV